MKQGKLRWRTKAGLPRDPPALAARCRRRRGGSCGWHSLADTAMMLSLVRLAVLGAAWSSARALAAEAVEHRARPRQATRSREVNLAIMWRLEGPPGEARRQDGQLWIGQSTKRQASRHCFQGNQECTAAKPTLLDQEKT